MDNISDNAGRKTRVTIKDVASAANVSIATVSYVLNNKQGQSISEDTRKKVLQTANLLGYECNVMAKFLATGKADTVAAIIKDLDGIGAQNYIKLITELTRRLSELNYSMKLCNYADEIARNGAAYDAYITIALSEKDFRRFADTKYVPVIAVDTVFDDFLFYRINDDFGAMYTAAKNALPDKSKIELLTYPLPDECLQSARAAFDGVTVVRSLRDLPTESADIGYATQSAIIAESIDFDIYRSDTSHERKAEAAVTAVNAAINRIKASADAHDIKV